jgi:geranylgeranyl reductase
MRSYDVIIIGAGPAGLGAAKILAGHGQNVLVLDRKSIIGPKVCGGGITWAGLIKRVPEELIEKSFPSQHIRSNFQRTVITSPQPIIATVQREALGKWMMEEAAKAGAAIKTSCHVKNITPDSVGTNQGEFRYRYLIGADGSSSIVRKYLKLATENVGMGIHYKIPGSFDTMEWHLNDSLFNNGYGWIFPFRDMASVGIYGAMPNNNPKKMLKNLKKWSKQQDISLDGLKPKAGLINFDYRGWQFGNTFLIGDAAGLASGLTGEGIYPALVSGETAAKVIINPGYDCRELNLLIRKQQKHQRILNFSAKHKLVNIITMEILILALRTGILPFSMLEMAEN